MKIGAIVGLLLVIALVSLSSYLRLEHSGIGCTPWPECYGNIGQHDEGASLDSAYERLLAEARQPMSWARPAHRLVASALGLLVLGLAIASLASRRYRLLSFSLLGLTVFLAVLGVYSEGLHSPAVVMGNLIGGFTMLGLFGWFLFRLNVRPVSPTATSVRGWTTLAIVMVSIQILSGGLTSANFAAVACITLPHCQGDWFPGIGLWTAFDLSRSIVIDNAGFAVGGAERAAIHQMHRVLALLTLLTVLLAATKAIGFSKKMIPAASIVSCIVLAELAVGLAAVMSDIPIGIAVAHNWLAGLLLLGLLYQRAKLP